MNTKKLLLSIVVCLFLTNSIFAQFPQRKDFNTWAVGIQFGPNFFLGDVSGGKYADTTVARDIGRNAVFGSISKGLDFNYGLVVTKAFSHLVGFSGELGLGQLKGEKTFYKFSSNINYEASASATFTVGNVSWISRKDNVNLVTKIGFGLMQVTPMRYDMDTAHAMGASQVAVQVYHRKADPTDGTVREAFVPIAIGLTYNLSRHFNAFSYVNYRMILSDRVDGSDRLHDGAQSTTSVFTNNDTYAYLQLGLTYIFGKKDKHIDWVNPVGSIFSELKDIRTQIGGLTGDKDKDGVADIYDKDSNTPEGVKVYGDGTSVDSDGDGVPDYQDAEPFTAKGAKVDNTGKEVDTDGDGVPDSRDLEPGTKTGTLVNFQGKTIPLGKSDDIHNGGETVASDITNAFLPSVFFETDNAVVEYRMYEVLANVARVLKANPKVKVTVVGNCDQFASEQYNQALGQNRANNVIDHLVKIYGLDKSRFTAESKGKVDPLAKNTLDSTNRRVDFKLGK